ncbi:MAG: hypothetical protein WD844_04540 [Thermoleophilaceae bacterium]
MESQQARTASRSRRAPGAGDLQEASERLGFAAVATKARPPNLDIALKNVESAVAALARYAERQAAGLEAREVPGGEQAAEAGPWNLRHFAHALEAAAAACAAARDSVRS